MILTFLSATWVLLCAAPFVFLLVLPLIRLDERMKRRSILRAEQQTFIRFG